MILIFGELILSLMSHSFQKKQTEQKPRSPSPAIPPVPVSHLPILVPPRRQPAEIALHEAIRSGDRVARMIYADWLEDEDRLMEASMLRSGQWCLIPAGGFWMGGGGGKAGHQYVTIPNAFYLGTTPVTQAEWVKLMGRNPSWFTRTTRARDRVRGVSDSDLEQFPVEQVSWDDVQEYIARRNQRETDRGWMVRLPTEAEWEYACRGAVTSREACCYHYYFASPTNDLSGLEANFNSNHPAGSAREMRSPHRPTPVGSYPPNRLGLVDMHGNVWEWCEDRYEHRPTERVLRGGCWDNGAGFCTASFRCNYPPTTRFDRMGFRLVCVPRV